jgi:uncharacterized phage-associated protein
MVDLALTGTGEKMFNEQKTAQIAAWFLSQERSKRMSHLKLMKLMYLADRESMAKHGHHMTGDKFVSMPQGPVLSLTLNHINDAIPSAPDGWDHWIGDKANHEVGLLREVDEDSLDELSEVDTHVLVHVWKKYGWMKKYEIRDFTHDPKNCPEWENPRGSSLPIEYEAVFEALGFKAEVAQEMDAALRAQKCIDRALKV